MQKLSQGTSGFWVLMSKGFRFCALCPKGRVSFARYMQTVQFSLQPLLNVLATQRIGKPDKEKYSRRLVSAGFQAQNHLEYVLNKTCNVILHQCSWVWSIGKSRLCWHLVFYSLKIFVFNKAKDCMASMSAVHLHWKIKNSLKKIKVQTSKIIFSGWHHQLFWQNIGLILLIMLGLLNWH